MIATPAAVALTVIVTVLAFAVAVMAQYLHVLSRFVADWSDKLGPIEDRLDAHAAELLRLRAEAGTLKSQWTALGPRPGRVDFSLEEARDGHGSH